MAQQTNLNVSPYFDDFDANDNYHKVLFKPGYPVQARELSGLQSILQNQIEKFGQHFFKEGAKVIPGNTAYSPEFFAVELNNTHLGVPVDYYIEQLIGRKIIGLSTGVTAIIKEVLKAESSDRGNLTIYVSYMSSGVEDSNIKVFADGELLTADSDIISGPQNNAFIPSGESFASCIATNATSTGASFSISNGVYFIRGNFVNVHDETIILSQYDNTPSGRIGLRIEEDIINADEDPTLGDNAKGFNNYAAPGADRLKISVSLYMKPLDDFNDSNFIELAVIQDGSLKSQTKNTKYNFLADELARRTYAESGDYAIKSFDVTVKNSLNDGLGNNGVYEEGQFTPAGTLAEENLAVYQVSPGKAFVKGYEIETISAEILDCPKTRDTKRLESQAVNYRTGRSLRLNRVAGAPTIGIGNTYIVSLRSQRLNDNGFKVAGQEIGLARVYDHVLESGTYSATNANTNEWDISLYDVQLTSRITLNNAITLTVPTEVKGKYSGATGFLKDAVSNSTSLDVYEKSGSFLQNEPFEFNGIANNRVAIAVTAYGIEDVKSVYGGPQLGNVGAARSFCGDVVQKSAYEFGSATLTSSTGSGAVSISTVTSENALFPGSLKVGNVLSFGGLGNNLTSYGRITEVNTDNVIITGVSTVSGVVEGALYKSTAGTTLNVPNLKLVKTPFEDSTENSLYTLMPKFFISDVDLTDASLTIRKTYTSVAIAGGQLTNALSAGTNETFLPFDEERYFLMKGDGSTVALSDDMFQFTAGSTTLQLNGLGADSTGCTLVATLKKSKPSHKIKRLNRVNSVIVNASKLSGSGIGATTLNDGLVYGNFPIGTRVQDQKIVLNQGDIINILGVFESNTTGSASAPKVTLSSLNGASGKTTDLIIGETFVGAKSGAKGIYCENLTDAQISFIVLNETSFDEGEVVTFDESKVQGIVNTIDNPSRNISNNYTYTTGQKPSFYDYGYITRRSTAKAPTKGIRVYFSNGYYETTDEGDITTKNSYDTWDYGKDIQTINGERVTDTIDIRPKVSNYAVVENVRSPLEFYGRSFDSDGNSAKNILASDESIVTNFSFYLGRIDRIFLTKDGKFQVQYGDPAEKPERPVAIEDSIEVGSCQIAPYLFDVESGCSLDFLQHKRYRMSDIKDLEDRIKNLEYYTSLSLLETDTSNMFVPDADGLNKFKSGFFVDNFTTLKPQETSFKLRNCLDPANKELRAQHYTTSIDLMPGPVEGISADTDLSFLDPEGTNIRKGEGVVTLDYTEKEWLSQQFATRTESVTPFLVSFWQAAIKLTPASDTWVDTARIKAKIIKKEGNFAGVMAQAMQQFGVDPQTGMSPIQWNAWETNWNGQDIVDRKVNRTEVSTKKNELEIVNLGWINGGGGVDHRRWWDTTTTKTTQDTIRDTFDTGVSTRSGTRRVVTEQWDNESLGDKVVSRDVIQIMRSRNLEVRVTKCKPLTEMFAFFDGVNVTRYCTPKLLEVEMQSNTFQVGETVVITVPGTGIQPEGTDKPFMKCRVAQANHRKGPYNAPTDVFTSNPYQSQVGATGLETFLGTPGTVQLASNQAANMPSTYSATTAILNLDTASLCEQAQGDFFGYAQEGMIVRGSTSGAQAKINGYRLISDLGANLIFSYYIPNPNTGNHPKFETGDKTLTVIDNATNDQENTDSFGEANYNAAGTLETVQESIISTRNATVTTKPHKQEKAARRLSGSSVIKSEVISTDTTRTKSGERWYDPLAQSFQVTEEQGVFITSAEVYFKTRDDMDIPMTFQIRTMKGGVPTQKVLPFSEVIKTPAEINVSPTGTVATKFEFEAPVYLEGQNTEYAICLASWSTKYQVFISRIGESDLLTDEFISQQPYLGSLFKSQNASTWDASQWEDLKFKINRAEFVNEGTLELYSPVLSEGNGQVAKLMPNSINIQSREVRVGLGSTLQDTTIQPGVTISQTGSNATGNYISNAGIGTGTMGVINAGLGYTPSSGNLTYTGVGLTNITAGGDYMYANVHISNGVAVAATITASGSGFQVGDVLGIGTMGNLNVGRNARFSVVSIGQTTELVLDNVQGDFATGVGKTMMFTHPVTGIATQLNWASGGFTYPEKVTVVHDGLHFTVDHRNHGMHHEQNRVTLSDITSDVLPTRLSLPYNTGDSGTITVDDSSNFTTFENVAVGATNPGYAKIGDEVFKYTGTSTGQLTGITRGINKINYLKGAPVTKYELGGISLNRFNKIHRLDQITDRDPNPISFDHYTIKIDQGNNAENSENSGYGNRSTGASFPILYTNDTKSTGGYQTHATQNIPFQIISPNVQNTTVPGTTISAIMRTVSGSSLGDGMGQGTDLPFQDQGYENITLNKSNYLKSPRCIASRVNETNVSVLQNFPGDRSFAMTVNLQTSDPLLTPVVDLQRCSAILVSNKIDAPIRNYATDNRVNTIDQDPTACQYISKENALETSATSIKIMCSAHINSYSDIRAFYAISENPNFEPIFVPFPGWKNLNEQGELIALDKSDGRPDKFTPLAQEGFRSNEISFREYVWTADDLPAFKNYRIKLVMTSTDQTYPPRISELRVITLA